MDMELTGEDKCAVDIAPAIGHRPGTDLQAGGLFEAVEHPAKLELQCTSKLVLSFGTDWLLGIPAAHSLNVQ